MLVVRRKLAVAMMVMTALGFLCWGRLAGAQGAANHAAAQGLFDAARELMKKGNYAEARPKFEESQRLDPGSGTLLNLAICYEKLHLTASAWATFLEAANLARVAGKPDRAKNAQQRADALAPRVSRLTIRVADGQSSGLEVRRDNIVVPSAQWEAAIPTDPGTLVVSAKAPGRKPWQQSVSLVEGAAQTISIPVLESAGSVSTATVETTSPVAKEVPAGGAPHEAPSSGLGTQRTIALVAGGIGVAGIVVGTVYGLKSKSERDASLPYCTGAECDPQGYDAKERAREAGNVSTVAFVVGGVGVVAGAVLWFTAPSNVKVGAGLGRLQIEGTW